MHGRTYQWLACVLAAVVACALAGVATAQGTATPMLAADPGYQAAGTTAPDTYMVSNYNADEASLADRVAELEASLKDVNAQQAAAKKAAAGKPSVTAGGRIYFDAAAFAQNAASIGQAGDMLNGNEARRARIFLAGDAFHVVDYMIEVDFVGQTEFKDVYMTINELPLVGHVRIGHFKEPWSLEEQTSSKFITFMERGLNNVFSPDRNVGVMAFNHTESENVTWAIGAFTTIEPENPPIFPRGSVYDDNGGTSVTMRATWLPWYDEATEGRGLLHTGICYTYRDIPELALGQANRFRITALPEAHLGNVIADTGWIDDADTVNAVDAEAAFVYGPFSAQAEYTWYWLDSTAAADPQFDGGYVYLSYFLTGEHRQYQRTRGRFTRITPFENFFRVRTEGGDVQMGKGAWEAAYRCSYLNLTDAGVRGGEVVDHTFGVNWYLNPYTRMMFNYVHSDTDNTDLGPGNGTVDVIEMRAQIDF